MGTTTQETEGQQQQLPAKKAKVVPPSDAFAEKKSSKLENVEAYVSKASSAMETMAAAFAKDVGSGADLPLHPFVQSMDREFKKVPSEKEFDCFMEVMRVIRKYVD